VNRLLPSLVRRSGVPGRTGKRVASYIRTHPFRDRAEGRRVIGYNLNPERHGLDSTAGHLMRDENPRAYALAAGRKQASSLLSRVRWPRSRARAETGRSTVRRDGQSICPWHAERPLGAMIRA
jgi:hypothetical protein